VESKGEEGEEADEDMICSPCGVAGQTLEAPKIKTVKDPGDPTLDEIESHNAGGHNPYRSWCPVCIEGRGKEDPHFKSKEKEKQGKPVIGLDYKTFGQEGDRDDKATVIVMRCMRTMKSFVHVCLAKGPSDEWIIDQLVRDIDSLGYADIIIKTDGEPALVKVMEAIQKKRKHQTIPQHPPAYDPQSNGAIEKAVDDFMCQMRCLKIGLERRLKVKIESEAKILEWLVEHSHMIIGKCQVGHDGKTPQMRLMGKRSQEKFIEIGEQVLAKPKRNPKSNRKQSLKSRWVYGTWVGKSSNSNEHIVVLAERGPAIKVRTVKRRPMSKRWNAEEVMSIIATPRIPNPRSDDQREPRCERLTEELEAADEHQKIEIDGSGKDLPGDPEVKGEKISR